MPARVPALSEPGYKREPVVETDLQRFEVIEGARLTHSTFAPDLNQIMKMALTDLSAPRGCAFRQVIAHAKFGSPTAFL